MNIKPREDTSIPLMAGQKMEIGCGVEHPDHGQLEHGDDVYDNMASLEGAPANVKTIAAYMIMRDTDWEVLLLQFLADSLEKGIPTGGSAERLEGILNFIKSALHSQVGAIKERKTYTNN